MPSYLFWLFSTVMLIGGVSVIAFRNPVSSALSVVTCFVGLAGLFIGLSAFFVGVIQILVYTGAVMVLFLFIIMLLDLKDEEKAAKPLAADRWRDCTRRRLRRATHRRAFRDHRTRSLPRSTRKSSHPPPPVFLPPEKSPTASARQTPRRPPHRPHAFHRLQPPAADPRRPAPRRHRRRRRPFKTPG